MKNTLMVVGLALALLCALMFSQKKSADKATAQARADAQSLSNQIAGLKVKVTEQTAKTVTCQDGYSNRVAEVRALSNRLARMTATLEQARTEARSAQAQAKKQSEESSALERQVTSLAQDKTDLTTALESTRSELAAIRQQLHAADQQVAALTQTLNGTRAEKDELSHQLNNLSALEARMADLRAAHKARRPTPTRLEAHGATTEAGQASLSPFQKNVKLQLQPDGSVKLVKMDDPSPISP
jgi:chromosome segregation ATPase